MYQESTDQRTQQLNDRVYERSLPSQELRPAIGFRSVNTKYSLLPIVDRKKEATVQLKSYPTFNQDTTFTPGNTKSPFAGFANNVNTESLLRNQYFAVQKADQAQYVPDSSSELYNEMEPINGDPQENDLMFREEPFNQFNPNTLNLGKEQLNNFTRQQLRNLTYGNSR